MMKHLVLFFNILFSTLFVEEPLFFIVGTGSYSGLLRMADNLS